METALTDGQEIILEPDMPTAAWAISEDLVPAGLCPEKPEGTVERGSLFRLGWTLIVPSLGCPTNRAAWFVDGSPPAHEPPIGRPALGWRD